VEVRDPAHDAAAAAGDLEDLGAEVVAEPAEDAGGIDPDGADHAAAFGGARPGA